MHSSGCLVVAGAGHQAQLAQRGRAHLLRLVDEEYRAPPRGLQVRQPALAQALEAAPAVVRAQRHGEDVAEFAVQVGQAALRMIDDAHVDVGQPGEAIGEQAQRHTFARARIAVDHREAALADLRVLDAPAEVLQLGCVFQRIVDGISG